jgi:hypothetical protein
MKAIAIMGEIRNIENVNDADVRMTFLVFLFTENMPLGGGELSVDFDSAASTTIINSKIVTAIVDHAMEQGYPDIDRKDVLMPHWNRG